MLGLTCICTCCLAPSFSAPGGHPQPQTRGKEAVLTSSSCPPGFGASFFPFSRFLILLSSSPNTVGGGDHPLAEICLSRHLSRAQMAGCCPKPHLSSLLPWPPSQCRQELGFRPSSSFLPLFCFWPSTGTVTQRPGSSFPTIGWSWRPALSFLPYIQLPAVPKTLDTGTQSLLGCLGLGPFSLPS